MAIDPTSENLLSLTDAAGRLPARRGGKRPHVSCLYRWSTSGCKGVVLETVQVGGTRCTTTEALARFFRRLTELAGIEQSASLPMRTPTARRRAAARAIRELEREGV